MKLVLNRLKLPDIMNNNNENLVVSKNQFKTQVKKAIRNECENSLKDDMKSLNKLKTGPMPNESFEKKSYITDLLPLNAKELFKYRSRMPNIKFNYKNDKQFMQDLWKCDSCQTCIESQNHVLFCPSYSTLREDKNLDSDEDLSDYLKKVLIIREKLNLTK